MVTPLQVIAIGRDIGIQFSIFGLYFLNRENGVLLDSGLNGDWETFSTTGKRGVGGDGLIMLISQEFP